MRGKNGIFEPTGLEEFQIHQSTMGHNDTEWKEETIYVKGVKGTQKKHSEFFYFFHHCSISQGI